MAKNLRILSAGRYLPEKVITNHDLERIVDTSDEWIFTRTGIRERRIANDTSSTSDLAAKALLDACDKCGLEPDELDAIVVATEPLTGFFRRPPQGSTECSVLKRRSLVLMFWLHVRDSATESRLQEALQV